MNISMITHKIGKLLLKNILLFQNRISSRNFNVPRRALMYVPGDDPKKISKSFTLNVDCIALDCEDGVAINRKINARETIRSFLDKSKPQNHEYDLGVRINALDTEYWQEDLKYCLTAQNLPDTILVPKIESAERIKLFSEEISKFIKADKKVNLIIYIESAKAFINLIDICKTSQNLAKTNSKFTPVSLVFGSDDFCANIGATRTENSLEILYARQKLVLAAKAFNLQAIDMVYIKYKDLEGLRTQCEQGMRMGYTGKQVIHPSQVAIVQEAFLPTENQIDWAIGLLDSFKMHQKEGKGAFTYKGSMIDMPTMKQAENIVKLAKLKNT